MHTRVAMVMALAVGLACCEGPQGKREFARDIARASERAGTALSARAREEAVTATKLARERMVSEQLSARGIRDERVLHAMRTVPRHEFVPEDMRTEAYRDGPLPIGFDQTISQPYIVALMTELLEPKPQHKVLEVGTGSGYQAAVLSGLVREVYSIEIVAPLAERAQQTLRRLGYANVRVRAGDGYQGWPEHAPFDAIIVTAAPSHIPAPLKEQLAVGGRLVVPVGDREQELRVITRLETGFDERGVLPVRFVPMTGEAQQH